MAHEMHHNADNKPKIALNSAFWFVLILVLLFIAAVNFVNVMGHSEHEEGKAEATHTETNFSAPDTKENSVAPGGEHSMNEGSAGADTASSAAH